LVSSVFFKEVSSALSSVFFPFSAFLPLAFGASVDFCIESAGGFYEDMAGRH
jgi:hypothetical protein